MTTGKHTDRRQGAAGGDSHEDTLPPARTAAADSEEDVADLDTMAASSTDESTASTQRYPSRLAEVDASRYAGGPEVARGGMGRIQSVSDLRLHRQVAIKELLDADDAYHVRRFEREALITARLQHPAIVPVYDAGCWASGEPFYSMKLVSGRPLDQKIANCQNLQERLALLPTVIAVAEAIAYAHSEDVIHRDLKPANVLVGSFGETVVLDWGLAKDLRAPETESLPRLSTRRAHEHSALTMAGSVLGTPAYMPPEQAVGDPVDEKADVFALGAILYHLLSGQLPYNATTTEELIAHVTASRVIPLCDRSSGLPPELVAIVDRAMAASPEDRYPSAREFAQELRRYQTGQLVGAHSYTALELIGRWVRRHRAAVVVGVVLATVLVAVSALGLRRIVTARNAAEQARAGAERREAAAEQLVDFMVVNLRDELEPIGRLDLLSGVGARVKSYYADLDQGTDKMDPADRHRWSDALEIIAQVQREQGALDAALVTLREAQSLAEAVLDHTPSDAGWRHKLARTHVEIGRALESRGEYDAAANEFGLGLESLRTLAAEHWDNEAWQLDLAESHDHLGNVLSNRGEIEAALAEFRSGLGVRERLGDSLDVQFGRSTSHVKIGSILQAQGKLEAALTEYRQARTLRKALVAAVPHNMRWQNSLAMSHQLVGDVLRERADLSDALAEYSQAMPIARRLSRQDPENTGWQRNLIEIYQRTGVVFLAKGDLNLALERYHAALAIAERLVRLDPDNASWKLDLSRAHNRIGDAHRKRGNTGAALASYQAAKAIRQELAKRDNAPVIFKRLLAWSHIKLGNTYLDGAELEKASKEMQTSLQIREKLVRDSPAHAEVRHELASSHIGVGRVLARQDKTGDALLSLRRGIESLRELVRMHSEHSTWQTHLAQGQLVEGDVHASRGDRVAAAEAYRASLANWDTLTARAPSNAGWQGELAACFFRLAAVVGDPDEAPRLRLAGRALLIKLKKRGKLPTDKAALLRTQID